MPGVSDVVFGDEVAFAGPLHGVVAFFIVVVVMLAAGETVVRLYQRLARKNP
jgi:hypothetical protein